MVKRKRSDKDEGEIIERVLKKVKKWVKPRKRIISSSSSSSSSSEETTERSPEHSSHRDLHDLVSDQPQAHSSHQDLGAFISDQEVQDEIPTEAPENDELDPEILELLGSDPSQDKSFGENLHKDLASRWKYILTNGLPKEEKSDIMKQYLAAENCSYMKAPLLNPELKSALSEANVKRDSYCEQKQNQMASCISAIGKALNTALTQSANVPQELIKTLSDAGRLLCDTHYRESLSRRFAIINTISKQKREIIKNAKLDDHLFGSNLSEHLKSSKAITASASELKFSNWKLRSSTSNAGALNARGAPRALAAEQRAHPSQYQPRRAPPLPPPPPPAHAARDYRRAPPPPPANQRSKYYYPKQARRR